MAVQWCPTALQGLAVPTGFPAAASRLWSGPRLSLVEHHWRAAEPEESAAPALRLPRMGRPGSASPGRPVRLRRDQDLVRDAGQQQPHGLSFQIGAVAKLG